MNEVGVIQSWGCRLKLNKNFLTFVSLLEGSYYLFVDKHFSKHLETWFRLDPYWFSIISFANNFRAIKTVENRWLYKKTVFRYHITKTKLREMLVSWIFKFMSIFQSVHLRGPYRQKEKSLMFVRFWWKFAHLCKIENKMG